jgi:hypothetical protein
MNTHQAKRRGSRVSALITAPLIGLVFVSLAHSTAVRTDDSEQQFALFPSDRYTVPDQNQVTGLRVALRKPDCSVHVSDCEDVDVVNQLDGFNVQPRIVIPFSGAIDLATVDRQSVYLLEVGSSKRIALNQLQWHEPSHTFVGASDELLRQHQRYLLVVTDDVRDSNGTRIEPAPFWAANTAGTVPPLVPSGFFGSAPIRKSMALGVACLIWAWIFSRSAVTDCVVKRLAATTCSR